MRWEGPWGVGGARGLGEGLGRVGEGPGGCKEARGGWEGPQDLWAWLMG